MSEVTSRYNFQIDTKGAEGLKQTAVNIQAAGKALEALSATTEVAQNKVNAYTEAEQKRELKMLKTQEAAIKMNDAMKTGNDEAELMGQKLQAVGGIAESTAKALGLPTEGLGVMGNAANLAAVGYDTLTKSAAGFNMVSLGVVGAGLAIGTTIGGWLRDFPIVASMADKAADALVRMFSAAQRTDAQNTVLDYENKKAGKAAAARMGKVAPVDPATYELLGALGAKISADKTAASEKAIADGARAVTEAFKNEKDAVSALGGEFTKLRAEYDAQQAAVEKYLNTFGPGIDTIETGLDGLAVNWDAVKEAQGGVVTDAQMDAYIGKVMQLANQDTTNGGFMDPATWDKVAAASKEQEAHLRQTGQIIDDGGGKWHRVGNEIERAGKKTDEVAQKTLTWHDVLGKVGQQLSALGSGLSELGSTLGSGALGQIGNIVGAAGSIAGDVASGNWAAAAMTAVNTIVGIFHKPEYKKVMNEVGRDWGVAISEGTAKAIEATENADHVSRQMAELLNLDKIMGDAGGDPAAFAGKIEDLFSAVAGGAVPAREGVEELGKAFDALKTAADGGSIASERAMIQMIQRERELGMHIPEMDAALKQMLEDASSGLDEFYQGLAMGGPGSGGAGQGKASQQLFDALYSATTAQYGLTETFNRLQGPFDDMVKSLPKGTHLHGAAAEFAQLEKLMKNDAFKGAASGAAGLAKYDKSMTDSGYASQKTTDAIGKSLETLYKQALGGAEKTGLKGDKAQDAALKAVLPLLTQLQHDAALGAKLTPEETKMLAEAQAEGLLPMKTLDEQQLDALHEIAANTRSGPGGRVPGYADGLEAGAITHTGPIMVHGSMSSPEYMVTRNQLERMRGSGGGIQVQIHAPITLTGVKDAREISAAVMDAITRNVDGAADVIARAAER